jgi:ATP adenylyltransferase
VDHLWSPWRYRYVTTGVKPDSCIFCDMPASSEDAASLIIHRARHNYLVLNRYPYSSGHLMVVPYAHISTLQQTEPETLNELIQLGRRAEENLRAAYHCKGLNLGFNIGECAGAGVAQHLHFHAVPRWPGDANFMTVLGETRVLPEELAESHRKLSQMDWVV